MGCAGAEGQGSLDGDGTSGEHGELSVVSVEGGVREALKTPGQRSRFPSRLESSRQHMVPQRRWIGFLVSAVGPEPKCQCDRGAGGKGVEKGHGKERRLWSEQEPGLRKGRVHAGMAETR